jgi:hypothetical protein
MSCLFLGCETIAGAVHGLDVVRVGGILLDLGAQIADMNIDRAFVAFISSALQVVQQLQA